MIDEIMADTKTRMKKSIAAVKVELAKIRTGRATPGLLDHVVVSYYGNDVPLNQAATISVSMLAPCQCRLGKKTWCQQLKRLFWSRSWV